MNILSQTSKAYNQCLRAPSHKVNFLVPKEYPNSKEYTRFLKTNSLPSLSRNATKRSKCIFMLTAQKRKSRVLSCPLSNHINLCLLQILRKNPQKKTSTTSRWRISLLRMSGYLLNRISAGLLGLMKSFPLFWKPTSMCQLKRLIFSSTLLFWLEPKYMGLFW